MRTAFPGHGQQHADAAEVESELLSPETVEAAIAAERERERLLAQVDVRQNADGATGMRMLPDAVSEYRGLVHQNWARRVNC